MDLMMIETGNGGDLVLRGNDLATVTGYENIPYLACFGGNDWWGNDLLLTDGASIRFSSTTEDVLKTVALNSAGRIAVENAILADLAFLKQEVPGTEITVSATVVNSDRLDIELNINGQTFYMQWQPGDEFLTYSV